MYCLKCADSSDLWQMVCMDCDKFKHEEFGVEYFLRAGSKQLYAIMRISLSVML